MAAAKAALPCTGPASPFSRSPVRGAGTIPADWPLFLISASAKDTPVAGSSKVLKLNS